MSDAQPYDSLTRVHVGPATAQALYVLLPLAKVPFGAAIESAYRMRGAHWGYHIYVFCFGRPASTNTAEEEGASRRQGAFRLALLNSVCWWVMLMAALLAARRFLTRRSAA